jgi:hypothetical protein
VRQGNIFFAGEHCSADYQGFMEGGAAEDARAAKEIPGPASREEGVGRALAGPGLLVRGPLTAKAPFWVPVLCSWLLRRV